MTKQNITVRFISTGDKSRWYEMWDYYLTFYKQPLSTGVTNSTPIYCSIAEDNRGQGLGFAIHFTHPGSWGIGDVCYLEGLYVAPEFWGNVQQ